MLLLVLATAALAASWGQSGPERGMWKAPSQRAVPIDVVDGLIVIPAELAVSTELPGHKQQSHFFVLDTAATATLVSTELARELGGHGSDGERLTERTLRLGGAEVGHTAAFVFPMEPLEEEIGQRLGGIAGSDIFSHFAVHIDYTQRLLTLMVPESCATPAAKIPLRVVGGLPFVQAGITPQAGGPEIQGLFLIDTGQPGAGMILTHEFVARHPELAPHTVTLPAQAADGTVRDTPLLRLSSLHLGAAVVNGPIAQMAPALAGQADAGLAGVIGAAVLGRFDLLIDVPGKFLVLTPNLNFREPFEADMSGIVLQAKSGPGFASVSGPGFASVSGPGFASVSGPGFASVSGPGFASGFNVAAVASGSPAALAGVRAGDRLMQLEGKSASRMTLDQVRAALKAAPGAKVHLVVERAGKALPFTLTLKRVL